MDILTSNVQVWHLVVVVVAFVLYEVWPWVFPESELEQEVCCEPIPSLIGSWGDEPATSSMVDELHKEFYRLREEVRVIQESRWQRKVARWIGAI